MPFRYQVAYVRARAMARGTSRWVSARCSRSASSRSRWPRGGTGRPSRARARASSNTQGLPYVPRAMKTALAAVRSSMRTASSAEKTSPDPTTGTPTRAATSSITVQSADPV